MLELETGTIVVDGIDISTICRQEARIRMTTISQDPFFPFQTVRENMDPLGTASDERIIEALCSLRLWDLLESRGGLDENVSEETLSYGQRQLFCIARALIRPGKIVILDEAASSVDSDTDDLVQQVLRERFQGSTIITIAHKLGIVMDNDRVVLLDKGRIVEVGKPQELMETPTSAFRALYDSMSHGNYSST
jgi:ABC-type multidrug transport system fused ATPase/permease subunit